MKDIDHLEIINISTKGDKLMAQVSYQDLNNLNSTTNGYNTIEVPINLRELQRSARGNVLVDQSIKGDAVATKIK